ncbi:unnamed protein product, partial [Polarella glacialis]
AYTFIHVESEVLGAAVARRSQSCPPKLFKMISSSKQQEQQPQQQKEAGPPEANQGHHSQPPSRLSTEQKLQVHQRGQCRPCSF